MKKQMPVVSVSGPFRVAFIPQRGALDSSTETETDNGQLLL